MSSTTRGAEALTNEINVTPMIDVLLVLLIIFLAAIPSMRKTFDVQLPPRERSSAEAGAASIVLELDSAGAASINRSPVMPGTLAARLRAVYHGRPDKVLFVKASGRLRYSVVTDAMDVARGSGVRVIGLP